MTNEIKIREINETDAKAIVQLSGQLGYAIDTSLVARQISFILSNKDHFAFVASDEEKVIGFIHAYLAIRLTSPPFLEITGLIVKEEYRNKEVGSKLVRHLESFITDDVQSIRVRCNVKRTETHNFYVNLGYLEKKKQKVFEKKFQ